VGAKPSTVKDVFGAYLRRLGVVARPAPGLATLAEQPLQAFASMCRYHQCSPESVFSKGLICTRATETGRITLSRNRLIIIDAGRRTETLATNASAVLNDHFGISDGA
jgi:arylamine N-acetyltransferase